MGAVVGFFVMYAVCWWGCRGLGDIGLPVTAEQVSTIYGIGGAIGGALVVAVGWALWKSTKSAERGDD